MKVPDFFLKTLIASRENANRHVDSKFETFFFCRIGKFSRKRNKKTFLHLLKILFYFHEIVLFARVKILKNLLEKGNFSNLISVHAWQNIESVWLRKKEEIYFVTVTSVGILFVRIIIE